MANDNVTQLPITDPYAVALAELGAENNKKAVGLFKTKLKELQAAELVVANIKRELDDMKKKFAQGDVSE